MLLIFLINLRFFQCFNNQINLRKLLFVDTLLTNNYLWGNDQLLVEDGTGIWSYENGKVAASGRYLLVWKKDEGEWKILRDTWFPDKKK